jgi:hypothetical protein
MAVEAGKIKAIITLQFERLSNLCSGLLGVLPLPCHGPTLKYFYNVLLAWPS